MDKAALVNFVRELELRYRPGRWMRLGPDGPFNGPEAVYKSLSTISRIPREVFIVIHLDGQNRPLGYDVASVGCSTAALVIPKDVVRPLIYSGAESALVVHQHPSGNSAPSPEDIQTTRRLRDVLDLCGLKLRDHVIIGDGEYTSLASEGLI